MGGNLNKGAEGSKFIYLSTDKDNQR